MKKFAMLNTSGQNAFVRVRIAMALGQIGDERVKELLQDLAADKSRSVRHCATEALKKLNSVKDERHE
jgi:HEAT repeat protein